LEIKTGPGLRKLNRCGLEPTRFNSQSHQLLQDVGKRFLCSRVMHSDCYFFNIFYDLRARLKKMLLFAQKID
jgi:hypothetical protein